MQLDRSQVVEEILARVMRAWAAAVPEETEETRERHRLAMLQLVRETMSGLWHEFTAHPERRDAIVSSCVRAALESLHDAWRSKNEADAAAADIVRQLFPIGSPPALTHAAFLANLVDYAEALQVQAGALPDRGARRRFRRTTSARYATVVRELMAEIAPDPMTQWVALVRLRETIRNTTGPAGAHH